MKQDKATSYEISERLDELGFECESHCGWWANIAGKPIDYSCYPWEFVLQLPPEQLIIQKIKAYDCWDLLMWLNEQPQLEIEDDIDMQIRPTFMIYWDDFGKNAEESKNPLNALGLAVIKILEEKNGI